RRRAVEQHDLLDDRRFRSLATLFIGTLVADELEANVLAFLDLRQLDRVAGQVALALEFTQLRSAGLLGVALLVVMFWWCHRPDFRLGVDGQGVLVVDSLVVDARYADLGWLLPGTGGHRGDAVVRSGDGHLLRDFDLERAGLDQHDLANRFPSGQVGRLVGWCGRAGVGRRLGWISLIRSRKVQDKQ